jgi:hypothetical protein
VRRVRCREVDRRPASVTPGSNSWDRVPYITTLATGKPSIVPQFRELAQNFIISNYASQEAIDTDDGAIHRIDSEARDERVVWPDSLVACLVSLGSSYYNTHDNFFAYAANGLKSDFGGHHNWHNDNVYAWVTNCWGVGNNDHFINNTCISNTDDGGFKSDCEKGPLMQVSGNQIYNAQGKTSTKFCDPTNVVAGKWPSAAEVVKMGEKVLGFTT